MSKNLLIIFTRNPELGKVKTRLAKTIGNENALSIYRTLLFQTERSVREINCDKTVFYSEKISNKDIWDNFIYQKSQQNGKNLGERMFNAFSEAFKNNYEKVIIIGSDLYDLLPNHINEAFQMLKNNDVVLGPADDGGYYLIGMNSLISQVFKNKIWGSSTVLKETLNDLNDKSVYLLETLNDIDVYDDLKNIEAFNKFLL
jgi:rSAM/selenodomain-associated transferase 1